MIEKIKKVNPVSLIVLVLVLFLIGYGSYKIYTLRSRDSITVTGTAEAQFSNQISSYSITVESHDKDKAKAVENAVQKSKEVVDAVSALGIDSKDVKTQNLNVYQREDPYYENGVTKYKPNEWYASYTVEIILRDLSKSEELTAVLVAIESTSMWGPNLIIDNSETDYSDLLAKAVENATEKAEKLAVSSGKKLGKVLNIVEGVSQENVYPLEYREVRGAGGSGFPIEAGSSTVSKTVTVTFELK